MIFAAAMFACAGGCALPGTLGENPASAAGLFIASNLKSIELFTIRAQDNPGLPQDVTAVIDQNGRSITAFVPSGTDRSALVPSLEYRGANVSPPSGQAADFRDLVRYTVLGDDGSSADYQVNLRDASLEANSITGFTFRRADNAGFTGDVAGTIFESSGVIDIVLPTGTNPASLIPTIAISGSSINPPAGAAGDFTNPVQYTVTAANGTTRTYNVIVSVAQDSSNQITSFGFTTGANAGLSHNLVGSINNANGIINVTVPNGLNLTALRANFSVSGGTVTVGGLTQTSDVTSNDFTNPVTYTVTAQDGSTRSYTIVQSTGLLALGTFTSYNSQSAPHIIRLNLDGTADTTFNYGTGFDAIARGAIFAPDGSGDIYVIGAFTTYQGVSANRIIRLNSDGSRDTSFNMGTGFDNFVRDIVVVPDGSGDIYVAGVFSAYNGTAAERIIRLNSDGSIDNTLAVTGAGQGFNAAVNSLAIAQDGSGDIYVGGEFTVYRGTTVERAARLNSDGTLDTGFAVTGVNGGFNDSVNEVLPLSDGRVYVGGEFLTYKTVSARRILRLHSDGSRDAGFGGTGLDGSLEDLHSIPSSGGDILIAGNFNDYNGAGIDNLVRVNADGTRDASFTPTNGFNGGALGLIYSVALLADGSGDLFAAGDYTVYDNTFHDGLVRLNADSSVDSGYTPGGFNGVVNYIFHR